MDKKAIWQTALASWLCDADLGGGNNLKPKKGKYRECKK